ncbi:MAG TPA: hypothetical protein VME66_09170 [Candidatus Acidoferrales bacterium]|nr:hypothetical protein [Candidatus Acidoferrales bacterium]
MDVRIGSIDATIVDSGSGGADDAHIERVARRVIAMIEQRRRSEERARKDRAVASPDHADVEEYG